MAAQQHRQEGVRTRLRAQPGSSRGAQEGLRVEHFMLSGALATAFVSPGEWAEGQSQREAGGGGHPGRCGKAGAGRGSGLWEPRVLEMEK